MFEKLIDVPRRTLTGAVLLLVAAGAIAAANWTEGSAPPVVPAASPQEFSAERAMSHVRRIATEPRPLGSPAGDRAKAYLVERLRAAGFAVDVQESVGQYAGTGLATYGRVENVVATLPGRDSTGSLVLAAHYDSAATAPGAADDGSGVAAIVETARAVSARGQLRNDVVLLITDGEEDGLLGADAFVREHPLAQQRGVVLNWEARGVTGPSLLFETSPDNAGLVEQFTGAVPRPRGDSSLVEVYRMMPNNSDFTVLSRAFPGLNFAHIDGAARYHTAGDTPENLDPGSLQHHGQNMLGLTRALGSADFRSLAADHDDTYFQLLGWTFRYPNAFGSSLAALAVLLTGLLVLFARRRRLVRLPRVGLAAVSAALPLVSSAVLGQGLWQLLVFLRPEYEAMQGLLHRPVPYQWALAAITALVLLSWYLLVRRRLGPAATAIGGLLWPVALTVLCAIYAPGAAFLFTWPALLAALAGLVALFSRRSAVWPVTALALATFVSAELLAVFGYQVLTGVGLALGGAGAVVFALFGLTMLAAVELFFPHPAEAVRRRVAAGVPLTGVALVAALIGTGLAVDRFDAEHPTRTHLGYVLNADTGEAFWVSGDIAPGEWTRRYVSGQDTSALPPGYARGELWTGPTPALDLRGPEVRVLSRNGDGVTFHVRSRREAVSMTLRFDHPISEVTARAPGAAPLTTPLTGTRARTWPGEIRFRDLPPGGVTFTVRAPGAQRLRMTAIDETRGLAEAPGFVPRPPDLIPSIREDGELIAVARTHVLFS